MLFVEQFILLNTITKLGITFGAFVVATILHRFSGRIAGLLLRLLSPGGHGQPLDAASPPPHGERRVTIRQLLASALSVIFFGAATFIGMLQFSTLTTLIWIFGFFSTAIAFAGAPFMGDLLSGFSIILQDKYMVGEKIQTKSQMEIIEGVVERVNLKTTHLRARTGELFLIANGEMRFVRNFTRGPHSVTDITLKIPAAHFVAALTLLKDLAPVALNDFPELKEPWLVLSERGTLTEITELTLVIKTDFGYAAPLRPKLMNFIQNKLAGAKISLAE